MSCLKTTGTVFIYIGAFLAMITFIPGLPPDVEFREYSVVPPRDLDPRMAPKKRLNGAEKLFEGNITGAEGFHAYNGQLYTGIHGGYVVRVEKDRIVPIAKFGKECDGIWQEDICGRPLGMRFDKKGNLFVMDSYYGIFKVDVASGTYTNIVNSSEPINGKTPKLPNSVDITENGDLYWTDSSTEFPLNHLTMLSLTNPSGRFMRYNAAEKKNEVLMENLAFANGVKLSDDESFVLVAETVAFRIIKYHLKGPKAGQQEIFIEGLPGMPDNLQSDGHGGFLVTTVLTIDSEHPNLAASLIPHPNLRKMLVRLLMLLRAPFKFLNDLIPNIHAAKLSYAILAADCFGALFDQSPGSLVLRIDASGNIMEVLSADDNIVISTSEAHIHDGYLWFGSPWRNYIARVPLKQAFPDLANNEKLSSHTNEKQSANADSSNINSQRMKRDADSVTTKPIESKSKEASETPKPTAAPTTTPKPTAAPTTTPKPTTAPKSPPPAPKASKPTATDSVKDNGKPNSPNAKSETNDKMREDSLKTKTAKSGKKIKTEQDTPVKQKTPKSEEGKPAETNRPKVSKKN